MKTKHRTPIWIALIVFCSLSALPLHAQQPSGSTEPRPDGARMQELREKIEHLKYERMKTALAMDDETAKKFFETYRPAEKEIQAIVQQRNQEMRKLRMMMNGAKSDADVDPAMARIRELNHQIEDHVLKLDNDLKPVLSPRQRAKLLVFEHEFNKRVRQEVEKQHVAKERRQEMKRHLREMNRLRRQELRRQLNHQ